MPSVPHVKNELVDLAGWPELDEVDLVAVLPAYAKARAVVWGAVALATGLLVAGPLTAIAVWGDSTPPWQLWVILGSVWALVMGLWGLEEWKGWPLRGYLVREHDVVYRSGWWSRTVVAVPFSRIQHSEIQQGPLGRWLGYCTLKLYTAGAAGANLEIPGLSMDTARNIRRLLEDGSHG